RPPSARHEIDGHENKYQTARRAGQHFSECVTSHAGRANDDHSTETSSRGRGLEGIGIPRFASGFQKKHYSYFNAFSGSTFIAGRAEIREPSSPTAATKAAMAGKVSGSRGLPPTSNPEIPRARTRLSPPPPATPMPTRITPWRSTIFRMSRRS